MFVTYVLYSQKLGKHYVGSTADIQDRLRRHNGGQVKFSSRGRPWILVHKEEFRTRSDAVKREREIKSYKGGLKFKSLIKGL